MHQLHITVQGRMQGVFFRAATHRLARRLGLTGWVCNCPDGSVEVLAEGRRDTLEQLLDWCWRGPSGARVTDVRATWREASGRWVDFVISHDTPHS
ncbi:MAG: acylphosphatase [Desulfurellaceae bacterium]|nr:acylphosphatase [Desulfurellaceae bacterium]